jgi:TetR/AcrR family transcriptional repressor of nem operon
MRVSRAQADQNRNAVIDVAGRLFREFGFDGIGLKDVMGAAGLTQGAFYKQFDSKEDLLVQASARALEKSQERWERAAASNADDPLAAVLEFYLSARHSTERADGCPIVALGPESVRRGGEVRQEFEDGIARQVDMIASWIGRDDPEGAADKAMGVLCTMVGAVLIARVVQDPQHAARFLGAARRVVENTRTMSA